MFCRGIPLIKIQCHCSPQPEVSRQDPSRQLFSLQVDLVMLGFGILDTHMKPQFPRQLIRFILGVGIGIIAASVTWCGSVFVYFFGNGRSEVESLIAGSQRGQFLFAWPLIGGLLAVPSRWGAVAVLVGICVHVAGALSHIVSVGFSNIIKSIADLLVFSWYIALIAVTIWKAIRNLRS